MDKLLVSQVTNLLEFYKVMRRLAQYGIPLVEGPKYSIEEWIELMNWALDSAVEYGAVSEFEQYEHEYSNGKKCLVWVRKCLKGKHRSHCLCHACAKFRPGQATHCKIAAANFKLCVEHNVVTPVYECPEFEKSQCAQK
jgi:hypothetical protein